MILLWLKIIYYKITRPHRAAPGEEPRVRARATEPANRDAGVHVAVDPSTRDGIVGYTREPGAPDDTIKTERLRRLIELGLVREPSPDDALRLELFEADREARQARARLEHDPRECPCAGRHYPSASACRWCACHRPIMASLPAEEIVVCGVCGHPSHDAGDGRCAFQVASRMQDGGFATCRCGREGDS